MEYVFTIYLYVELEMKRWNKNIALNNMNVDSYFTSYLENVTNCDQ